MAIGFMQMNIMIWWGSAVIQKKKKPSLIRWWECDVFKSFGAFLRNTQMRWDEIVLSEWPFQGIEGQMGFGSWNWPTINTGQFSLSMHESEFIQIFLCFRISCSHFALPFPFPFPFALVLLLSFLFECSTLLFVI